MNAACPRESAEANNCDNPRHTETIKYILELAWKLRARHIAKRKA